MQMLYDSESFVVVHMLPGAMDSAAPATTAQGGAAGAAGDATSAVPQMVRHGFEIVDKRSGKEVYLDGSWAELFQQQIVAWQHKAPTQEEVEDTLDRYASLAQNPVVMH